jgi:hypothetical protein
MDETNATRRMFFRVLPTYRLMTYRPARFAIITIFMATAMTGKTSLRGINGLWQTFASLTDFPVDGEAGSNPQAPWTEFAHLFPQFALNDAIAKASDRRPSLLGAPRV